jgi:hypothetical protein
MRISPMRRLSMLMMALLAGAGASAEERADHARDAVQIGVLNCQPAQTAPADAGALRCLFDRASGRGEIYAGRLQRTGNTDGEGGASSMIWAVYASPARASGLAGGGALAGRYDSGAPTDAGLIGPAGRIALEPMSPTATAASGLDLSRPR